MSTSPYWHVIKKINSADMLDEHEKKHCIQCIHTLMLSGDLKRYDQFGDLLTRRPIKFYADDKNLCLNLDEVNKVIFKNNISLKIDTYKRRGAPPNINSLAYLKKQGILEVDAKKAVKIIKSISPNLKILRMHVARELHKISPYNQLKKISYLSEVLVAKWWK